MNNELLKKYQEQVDNKMNEEFSFYSVYEVSTGSSSSGCGACCCLLIICYAITQG